MVLMSRARRALPHRRRLFMVMMKTITPDIHLTVDQAYAGGIPDPAPQADPRFVAANRVLMPAQEAPRAAMSLAGMSRLAFVPPPSATPCSCRANCLRIPPAAGPAPVAPPPWHRARRIGARMDAQPQQAVEEPVMHQVAPAPQPEPVLAEEPAAMPFEMPRSRSS